MKKVISTPVWLNKTLFGFGFASLLSDANHELVPVLLPGLLTSLVGPLQAPQFVGIISGASTAAASFTTLFSGWLSDRVTRRKPIVLIGYFVTGIFVGMLAWAHTWMEVFILLMIAWIGRGMISAPRSAIIADSVDPAYYGHAFGFRQAMDTLGAILGPLIIYALAGWPPQSIFAIALIPAILAFIIVARFISEKPHQRIQAGPSFIFLALPSSFYLFLSALFIFGLGNFNRTLMLLRIQNSFGSSQAAALGTITLYYIFRNVMQTISSYSIGALSDRIGRRVPLALCGFIPFGIMSFALIWPSTHPLYLILIFFLSGSSAGVYTALGKSMAADLLPLELRGTGYGIMQTLESIADLISSMTVGFLWTFIAPEAGFIYAGVLSCCAALMLFFHTRATR